MFELNRLYNADCMEAMKEIPDNMRQQATRYWTRTPDRAHVCRQHTEQGIIFWVLRSKKTISRKQTNACGKKWRKCVLIFFSGGIRQHERKRRGSRRHKIRRTLKTEKERRKNDRFGSGNPKRSSRTKLKIKPVIIIRFVRQKVKENGGILTAVTTC